MYKLICTLIKCTKIARIHTSGAVYAKHFMEQFQLWFTVCTINACLLGLKHVTLSQWARTKFGFINADKKVKHVLTKKKNNTHTQKKQKYTWYFPLTELKKKKKKDSMKYKFQTGNIPNIHFPS